MTKKRRRRQRRSCRLQASYFCTKTGAYTARWSWSSSSREQAVQTELSLDSRVDQVCIANHRSFYEKQDVKLRCHFIVPPCNLLCNRLAWKRPTEGATTSSFATKHTKTVHLRSVYTVTNDSIVDSRPLWFHTRIQTCHRPFERLKFIVVAHVQHDL